jgi:lipoteichoic acid synthase
MKEIAAERLLGNRSRRTRVEFLASPMAHGLTPMLLDDLARRMWRHPDARIVTDVKSDNVRVLRQIRERYGNLADRFIPQIYSPDELAPVRNLGYRRIIFTLYRTDLGDDGAVMFAARARLCAVTMFNDRALASNLPATLGGVAGIYTDSITPAATEP